MQNENELQVRKKFNLKNPITETALFLSYIGLKGYAIFFIRAPVLFLPSSKYEMQKLPAVLLCKSVHNFWIELKIKNRRHKILGQLSENWLKNELKFSFWLRNKGKCIFVL